MTRRPCSPHNAIPARNWKTRLHFSTAIGHKAIVRTDDGQEMLSKIESLGIETAGQQDVLDVHDRVCVVLSDVMSAGTPNASHRQWYRRTFAPA
jgi:hypothetical protein